MKILQKSTTLLLRGGETQKKIFEFLDYTEILFKEYLQLLNYDLLFLLSVATTETGHCWEYLVNVCAYCAYRSITKSILHELGGLVCFQVLACENLIQVVLTNTNTSSYNNINGVSFGIVKSPIRTSLSDNSRTGLSAKSLAELLCEAVTETFNFLILKDVVYDIRGVTPPIRCRFIRINRSHRHIKITT